MCIVFFQCLWSIVKKTLGFLGEWTGRTASSACWCTPLTFAKRNKNLFQKSKINLYMCVCIFFLNVYDQLWRKPSAFWGRKREKNLFFQISKINSCMHVYCFFQCLWSIVKKTLGFLGEWMGRTASSACWCTPLTFAKRNKPFSKIKNKVLCIFFFKCLWPIVKKILGFLGEWMGWSVCRKNVFRQA